MDVMTKKDKSVSKSKINASNPKRDFYLAATNMSWQLAIVVLVPVIGGFKIDEHFDSLPFWTFIGFILAIVGMTVVVWRQLQLLSPKLETTNKGPKK